MRFKSLPVSPILRKSLARMGYHEPTPIQAAFLEPALAGHDAIGLAKTGTGKTTAFLLPIAERLLAAGPTQTPTQTPTRTPTRTTGPTGPRKGTGGTDASGRAARRLRALVLCPTRELALQVAAEASHLLRGSGLRIECVHGKVAMTPQVEALARGVDLLIGTPGRLRDLLESESLDLSFIRTVALDEADRMLDMGFEPQVRLLLESMPGDRQTLMLSATMPAAVERLAQEFLRRPVKVEVDPTTTPVTHVRQWVIGIADDLKVPLLLALLAGADRGSGRTDESGERHGVLIFCRTRRRAGWIATALKRHRISVGSLHGDKSHAQRTRSLSRFSKGDYRVLVATDVASRGLHVEAVQCVISYDLPTAPEEHVHRIGRAAHGLEGRGGHGEAIVLLSPDEQERWAEILPLVGEATKPERAPRLDRFLANAPDRTQRAAGTAPTRKTGKTSRTTARTETRSDSRSDSRLGSRSDSRRQRDESPTRKKKSTRTTKGSTRRGKSTSRPKTPPRVGTGVKSLRKNDE